MIISHTNKFIFFKATKVAGTSTELFFEKFCDKKTDIIGLKGKQLRRFSSRIEAMQTLNNKFWNHMPPLLIKQQIAQHDWETYLKFGNIRNPWDRMVSCYFYKRDNLEQIPYDMPFEVYVKNTQNAHPISLCEYYGIDNLQEEYKYIRYENLQEDILHICDMLNLKPYHNLRHANKTNRNPDYKVYYNKETRKIVEQKYQKDIEIFNYSY
tara:strand:+ start:117 stop:746 length:630 start_codon:yes stop_codon:yes gene_type:complete